MMTDWRRRDEDTISTESGNSDPEMNLQRGSSPSESTLLRLPHVRRVVPVEKRKGLITALAFVVLLIVGAVFGTLYYSGGDASTNEGVQKKGSLNDHEIFVRDIGDTTVHVTAENLMSNTSIDDDDDLMLNDSPRVGEPRNSDRNATKRKKPKSKKNRTPQANHGPRKLPEKAQDASPVSLLYQMKLAHGKQESFVNYTECLDVDIVNQKTYFKGWKAELLVNLAAAGFNATEQPNVFIGYGTKRNVARQRAAENALFVLYPKQLEYSQKDDLKEIEPFCNFTEKKEENSGPGPT